MGKKVQKASCIFGANYMLEQVNQLKGEIMGALALDDIEYIHRLRVASRRLRNGLGLFRDCLSAKKFQSYQENIRQITKALGKARDLDIQIECVDQKYDLLSDARFKPGYGRLLLRLKQQRIKAQQKVAQTLNQLQETQILEKIQSQLTAMTSGTENMYLFTPSLYKRSFSAINDRLEEFLSYQAYVYQSEKKEKLHAMRISGKHLRYTMEIFAPIYKESLSPYIQFMKELQDQLGAIHDADVWVSWLPLFITKEQKRIEDYFGNSGPLKRLIPGFEHLIEDRQKARELEYQSFLATWENLQAEQAWKSLREILQTPINVEAALSHLASDVEVAPGYPEEEFEVDEDQTESDFEVNSGDSPHGSEKINPTPDPSTQNLET